MVVTGSPVIFLSSWYGALFVLGECGLMRKPLGMGSNCLDFAWMLARFRQNHDWCTNGPCAGSIRPIIPWSMCEGSSQERCVILYLSLKTFSAGASGILSGRRVPGAFM